MKRFTAKVTGLYFEIVKSLVKDSFWHSAMFESKECLDILEHVMRITWMHHSHDLSSLVSRSLNHSIFPGYLNASKKVPSIKLRAEAIQILSKFMLFQGHSGWFKVYQVLGRTHNGVTYWDLFFRELRFFVRDCWRYWSGIAETQMQLFKDLERANFRLDIVWRFKNETFPVVEMNELTNVYLGFLRDLLVTAPDTTHAQEIILRMKENNWRMTRLQLLECPMRSVREWVCRLDESLN
jgi:hypothetical protein